ncbi:TonB-dependent receptor [Sphingobacteriales bacterium UPWRP_1]|nr:hypothetical protein B6N25_03775 [Sphingobacteriales bacterium TSM_CSS]PSJ76642.1 TonB-dependent receptor [Sphingobacteriales bacterium UPWRP_1]
MFTLLHTLFFASFTSVQRSCRYIAPVGALLFGCFFGLQAQNPITGLVFNAQTLEPLPGATVTVLPSGAGTVTDTSGQFTLAAQPPNQRLLVSFIGFQKQETAIPANGRPLRLLLNPATEQLATITVSAYNGHKLLQTPAAIAQLKATDLQQYDNISAIPAINRIPGVKMEQRSMGSYRISIRGSLLRSPFGMRNIKMYLNDMPITDAGGENPINNLDLSLLGNLEVVKGPAGSLYGAGTGGVLLFTTAAAPPMQTTLQTNALWGSYELQQYNATLHTGSNTATLSAAYTRRNWNGYRQHETHRFDGINAIARFFPDDKRTITLMALYADVRFDIAGNIDSAATALNPRQYGGIAKELNAHVDKQRLITGVSQHYRANSRWSNVSSATAFYEVKDNPFGTNNFNSGFKRESGSGFNLRTQTNYHTPQNNYLNARFSAGAEWLHSFLASKNYQNLQGIPGNITEDNELFQSQVTVFGQVNLQLPAQFFLDLGGSYNLNLYRIDQLLATRPDSVNFSANKNLKPVFSPRVGLTKMFTANLSAYASVSRGFAPPAVEEIILPDGKVNTDLTAENGTNYEIGLRGSTPNGRLSADVSAYRLLLDNEILAQGQPAVYYNAGKTLHSGIETALYAQLVNNHSTVLQQLNLWAAYALQQFTFEQYTPDAPDQYKNNQIPGVPKHTFSAGATMTLQAGLYLNAAHYYYAKMPLNNANTDFAPAYHLLNMRTGIKRTFVKHWQTEVFFGINNMLNAQYSSFHNLNAPGKRYFNPSPGINYYGGVSIGVTW